MSQEMKELQQQYKAASKEIAAVNKRLGEVEEKKEKHVIRLNTHDAEVAEVERALASVIEKVARDEASERDIDQAQSKLDHLQKKRVNLEGIISVIDEGAAPLRQLKAEATAKLERLQLVIEREVSEQLLEGLKKPVLDAFAVHSTFYAKHGSYISIYDYFKLLGGKLSSKEMEPHNLRTCANEMLQPFLK